MEQPTAPSAEGHGAPAAAALPGPQRVLLVETNTDGTVGGSHQALLDLVRNIDRARYVPVALFYEDNRVAGTLRQLGVEVHVWESVVAEERGPLRDGVPVARGRRRARAVLRRVRFLRDARIALVHINNSPAMSWHDWLPASRILGVPCVTHARAVTEPGSMLQRAIRRRYDRVIAISRYVERSLQAEGLPLDRIELVYDGIDGPALQRAVRTAPDLVRAALGIGADKVLAAMVGHLRSWKGQHVVLSALTKLPSALRDQLRVIFVGGTAIDCRPYALLLGEMIRQHRLEDCVQLLGERSDAPELMNAADIVLHASTDPEPFGLVVVEGMVLGKAVVASRLGGPSEVITPGSGITFNPKVPGELAAVLGSLISNRAQIRSLADNARRRARQFTAQRTASGIERVYDKVLRRRR